MKCDFCGSLTHERPECPAEGYRPEPLAPGPGSAVEVITGIVELVPMGPEFNEDGLRLRSRFNCNFRHEPKSGFMTLHALHETLRFLEGQRVKITIERLNPYASFNDWISLMDPAETRDHPLDQMVQVMGASNTIETTYFSSTHGDWMCHGDPTHWRPIPPTEAPPPHP